MYQRVLVTGGAGFIGSRLCARLHEAGHNVISLDNYFTGSRDNHVAGVDYREGHTKDIARLVPEHVDIVYHLGEYSRVEQSLIEPNVVFDLNSLGTQAVLEFWRARGCKLVYAGSSTKFSDGGLGRNLTPYTWTKATNTELVKNYAAWYDLPFAITYFYNVYGPGEMPHGRYATLVAIFKDEVERGTPLTVVAPGTQQRNFTHVDDTVDGLILAGEKGEGDEFGIGAQESLSIIDVARMFNEGAPDDRMLMVPEHAGNRMTSFVDTSKIRALGWRQQHTLKDYVADFLHSRKDEGAKERRVLVFSTTFYPTMGTAERALYALMERMPEIQFDVITTHMLPDAHTSQIPLSNVTIYRVGSGSSFDKYMLPHLGSMKAKELMSKNQYLFAWGLLASYAALAAKWARGSSSLPLLITLADHDVGGMDVVKKFVAGFMLGSADQISALTSSQENYVAGIGKKAALSNRSGDAFANQIRVTYNALLQKEF